MVINIDVADLGAYHRIGRLKWLISDPKLKSRHLRCSLGNICAATSKSFGVSISIDPRCIMHNLFVKEITIWNRIIKITEINEWSSNDSSNSIANKENNHAFFAFSLLRISRTQEQKHRRTCSCFDLLISGPWMFVFHLDNLLRTLSLISRFNEITRKF